MEARQLLKPICGDAGGFGEGFQELASFKMSASSRGEGMPTASGHLPRATSGAVMLFWKQQRLL